MIKNSEINLMKNKKLMRWLPLLIKQNHVNFIKKAKQYILINEQKGACQKGKDCPYSHDFPLEKLTV